MSKALKDQANNKDADDLGTLPCPICRKLTPVNAAAGKVVGGAEAAGRFFPFCSDRCRLIDLGRWLDGKYQIPVVEEDESGQVPPKEFD